ncbi:hypothetical protein [Abyssibius alkaniclasticus]|uniref:hypothetical protein n=1 Tax=Abyssibius alkaniclasticus TaxID=2881234 RepID=UPI0040581135
MAPNSTFIRLLAAHDAPAAPLVASEAQPLSPDRAAHILWLSKAAISNPLRRLLACRLVRVAQGQTLRLAAEVAGVAPDADRLTVGIPEICL